MPDLLARAQELLRTMYGPAADFRDGQWDAIENLVARQRRVLVVQRTGWGKSLVYFLAAKLLREQKAGSTLLISPLLSLMRNQVEMAKRIGIRAHTIHSGNREEWDQTEADLANDIVGSREVKETGQGAAQFLGAACADNGWVVSSGGARGVDGLAMNAALERRGQVVGLLADSLERTVRNVDLRASLKGGTLTLITPYSPKAPFSVGAAMGRNRLIYALADYAMVVACEAEKGGTWSGAVEALKHDWVPVFVCDGVGFPEGNRSLQKKGAISFPIPFPDAADAIPALAAGHDCPKPTQGNLFGEG